MCTRPITITKTSPFGIKQYTVPCGKCPECISKKRSELAALSVHQASVSGSLHFFTLTYRNERCPIAHFDNYESRVVAFSRDCSGWLIDGEFCNFPLIDLHTHLVNTPSLCREDVKKWLKKFRTRWSRLNSSKLDFKYCVFGEYGDRRGRPHYHGLFYGLTSEQAEFAASIWKEDNGFVFVAPAGNRKLSLDEISAVSNYVSKYISKGVCFRFANILPFVEAPRRQSSINFGQFSDDELAKYASFMMGAISSPSLDAQRLTSFVASRIDAKLFSLMVDDTRYPNL